MAPMAMKSILKEGALGKAKGKPVPVGKFAALGKAKAMAKSKALAKEKKALGKAKAKAKAKKLSKSNLEKLGELTLADKIKAAAELGGEDEENAPSILKESLTPDENSQVWGRHQTWKRRSTLEKVKRRRAWLQACGSCRLQERNSSAAEQVLVPWKR